MLQPDPLPPSRPPWRRGRGLGHVVESWRQNPRVAGNLVLDRQQPAVAAQRAARDPALPAALAAGLAACDISELYAHQAEALAHARAGRHLVVSTPTASGKSLCYNLPVIERLLADPQAASLYIFPTKALCRDQEAALRGLLGACGLARGAITFDGDTPADVRRSARGANVVFTNPDMLHAAMLPHHASWARLLGHLAFVVVDELHTLRGVFGSHVAHVLRRLMRVARFHGGRPTFVFASATIGNAAAHASELLGAEVVEVAGNGAPQGPRQVMIYNPPVVNATLGVRASAVSQAVELTWDLIAAQVPTLVFGQSRNAVETMLKYLRDRAAEARLPQEKIVAYRGGYLPRERRRIEAALRAGEIGCVVATNALELGIDIGALDAVVSCGYPGSVAGMWQRFGRAGRRGSPSLGLLVATNGSLDQYWAQAPEALLSRAVEQARVAPDNLEILVQHVKCAAFELPFRDDDQYGNLEPAALADILAYLAQHQVVHPVADGDATCFHWATDAYPAHGVSLRQVAWDNVVVVELPMDRNFAEMDWRSAHTMLHEQAIYQHDGRQYQVERFDLDNRKAFVRRVRPDYYTDAQTHTKLTIIGRDSESASGRATLGHGEVKVTEQVVGFKKIRFHSHENVGYGRVTLPAIEMHTGAFWLSVDAGVLSDLGRPRPELIDALIGLGHAVAVAAAVALMTDPRDLGRTLEDRGRADGVFCPTLFVYDAVAGGMGLSSRLFEHWQLIVARARELIAHCGCPSGCPGCVGPAASAGAAAGSSRRPLALAILNGAGLMEPRD